MFNAIRAAVIEEFGNVGVNKRFHFDMEVAAMNACREVFPESQCTTCYFHFAKNIMDYVERKGLRDAYSDPERGELYDWIRTFVGSAMLPQGVFMERLYPFLANNVPAGVDQAQSQSITEVSQYISSYWVPRRTLWEQYQNDGPRTTNHAEGWHNQLRILFTSQHPQLGLFLKEIKKEINAQALRGNSLFLRLDRPKERLIRSTSTEQRMLTAKGKFDTYLEQFGMRNISIQVLLQYCRHQAYNCSRKAITSLMVEHANCVPDKEELDFDPPQQFGGSDDELFSEM